MPENAKSPSEPSMEEIIASISRIITEDKKANEAAPVAPAENTEILELTEAVNEDGSVRRLVPQAENPSAKTPGTQAVPEPTPAPGGTGRERILSSATSEATAAAFAQLGSFSRERRREGDLPLGGADRTLEDIVRDLLRPLLQAWLDEHLPSIVERLVREEIARVVGDAGLR
ncbi:MAG: DUF2497 domain-containing protein [Xanthobacteraceae bacterium]|nr:DUF2497 domain-containing protein [Xanthobacteraceae bacterium]